MNVCAGTEAQGLVAEAAAWRLASLLLERPRPQWRAEVVRLASEVSDPKLRACAQGVAQGSEETYHRLFGPGGSVSAREVSYSGLEDPGHLMAEIEAFYRAFSFQPRREEPSDHISVEAGFVGYLFLKEAYARVRGEEESTEVTRRARERFVDTHLRRFARGMAARLADAPAYLRDAVIWLSERA